MQAIETVVPGGTHDVHTKEDTDMFFDTGFKPEIICHEDKTRANITTVELVREGSGHYLVATNGVSLIKVPCSGVQDYEVCGPIQSEAFEAARKIARKIAKKTKSGVGEIICRASTLTFADGSSMPRVSHGDSRFPDYQRVTPTRGDPRHLDAVLLEASKVNPGPYTLRFGLDPALLSEIVKAQGRRGVVELEVTIEPPYKDRNTCQVRAPITLRWGDVVGIVMPGAV